MREEEKWKSEPCFYDEMHPAKGWTRAGNVPVAQGGYRMAAILCASMARPAGEGVVMHGAT